MFETVFATAATADQTDAGIGVIWWGAHSPDGYALTVLDYDLADVADIDADWIAGFFKRSAELVAARQPAARGCLLRVEHPGLVDILNRADSAYCDTKAAKAVDRSEYDILPIKAHESEKWPATLDERAYSVRPLVDSGKVVKVEMGLRLFN